MHPIQNLLGGELARAMIIQVLLQAIITLSTIQYIYIDPYIHIYTHNNDRLRKSYYACDSDAGP